MTTTARVTAARVPLSKLSFKEKEGVEAVSVGAILSDYQRVRVENVCMRLQLQPLAYLWRRDQETLLREMISSDLHALIIKVAAFGKHARGQWPSSRVGLPTPHRLSRPTPRLSHRAGAVNMCASTRNLPLCHIQSLLCVSGVILYFCVVFLAGLDPEKHLGKPLAQMELYLKQLSLKYGVHVCGEGGEYETFTLDCPLFKKKILIDSMETVIHSADAFAPVGYLRFSKMHVEDKMNNSLEKCLPLDSCPCLHSVDKM
ncbi:hypothetical protein JZ751_003041, partial [Albula glossodonta]